MGFGYYGYGSYYSQPTVAELKAKARAGIAALRKKGREPSPVTIPGNKITTTWWGDAWCKNLERYADYENRIDRGKRYVRADCVIDLRVTEGRIDAVVQGTRTKPYEVRIDVAPMDEGLYSQLTEKCAARASSLEALASGDFPAELKEYLFDKKEGIFPSPGEVTLSCSCPDGAHLCKHVAAALYGVGSRLDVEPLLLFTLRGIDTDALIKRTIEEKLSLMLANADTRTARVLDIDDAHLTELFGVL